MAFWAAQLLAAAPTGRGEGVMGKAGGGPGQPGAQSCDGSIEHSSLLGGTSCGRSVLLCMFIPP